MLGRKTHDDCTCRHLPARFHCTLDRPEAGCLILVKKSAWQEQKRELLVHRKGATRAFPPGHREVPSEYRDIGQPVDPQGHVIPDEVHVARTRPRMFKVIRTGRNAQCCREQSPETR
jgi:hypothetical protein